MRYWLPFGTISLLNFHWLFFFGTFEHWAFNEMSGFCSTRKIPHFIYLGCKNAIWLSFYKHEDYKSWQVLLRSLSENQLKVTVMKTRTCITVETTIRPGPRYLVHEQHVEEIIITPKCLESSNAGVVVCVICSWCGCGGSGQLWNLIEDRNLLPRNNFQLLIFKF